MQRVISKDIAKKECCNFSKSDIKYKPLSFSNCGVITWSTTRNCPVSAKIVYGDRKYFFKLSRILICMSEDDLMFSTVTVLFSVKNDCSNETIRYFVKSKYLELIELC